MARPGPLLCVAALAMRRILVDYARRHRRAKRGVAAAVSLDEGAVSLDERAENLVALDEALTRLQRAQSRG